KKLVPLLAKESNKSDQDFIKELLECGELTPVIDRCYTLSEVPDALRYLEKGHAREKVVITMRRWRLFYPSGLYLIVDSTSKCNNVIR
ncbi:MAG: zinc-binding dehydrogenase, partial [Anaerolineales bacterium]